jgi:hypothetical protein
MSSTRTVAYLLASALLVAPAAARAQGQPDLSRYTLTMDVMRKAFAVGSKLNEAADKDPSLTEPASWDESDWAPTVARLEKSAAVSALLKQDGLTPREFVTAMTAFKQAATVMSFQMADKSYKVPPNVNPKNVEFVKVNMSELAKLADKLSP